MLRDLVVVKICKEPGALTELTAEELTRVRTLVAKSSVDDLMRLHLGFSRGFDQVVHAPQQRSALEMLLLRLAMRPPLLPVDDLVSRLDALDRRLAGRGAAPSRGAGPRASTHERSTATSTPLRSVDQPDVSRGNAVRAVASASPDPVAERSQVAVVEPEAQVAVVEPEVEPEVQVASDLRSVESALPSSPMESEPPTEPFRRTQVQGVVEKVGSSHREPLAEGQPNRPTTRPTEPPSTEQDPATVETWRAILERVRERNAGLASVLEHAVTLEVSPQSLCLAIEEGSFYAERARDEQALDLLTRVVREHFRASTEVSFTLLGAAATSGRTLYEKDEAERLEREEKARRALEQHKLVRAAVEGLGARIQRIKLGT